MAAIVTTYTHNSHADLIVGRLLQTDTLDGKGQPSPLKLASLYTDQRKPDQDIGRRLSAAHGFRVSESIEDALTLGTGRLAVDGVLLIAEPGDYPTSALGLPQYPKRRFWEETIKVFRASKRVVPVFVDKHLADDWTDTRFIYDSARALKIPLMAGSSVPLTWRRPPADVPRGSRLREIVAITYHLTEHYGFHALEMVQALAEQREGGETGLRSAQTLTGSAVWRAFDEKTFDPELFDAAWKRLSIRPGGGRPLRQIVREPKLFRLEYADGLRAHVLELDGAALEWSAAWRYAEGPERPPRPVDSTLFWVQDGRPAMHFALLLHGVERMMLTGKPSWNVARTLLTSGALQALLRSEKEDQRRVETPHLMVPYRPTWRWTEPPPPPPTRPWAEP